MEDSSAGETDSHCWTTAGVASHLSKLVTVDFSSQRCVLSVCSLLLDFFFIAFYIEVSTHADSVAPRKKFPNSDFPGELFGGNILNWAYFFGGVTTM